MGYIETVYAHLEKFEVAPDNLINHDLYYCWAAVREKFPERGLSLDQVLRLLYEEGLLGAKSYDIPRWYSKKWFPPDVKKALQDLSPAELRPTVDTVFGSKATTVSVPHEIEDTDELPF